MNLSLDKKLCFGSVTVAASETALPDVIGFGKYGPVEGIPIGLYAKEPVTGTITVKVYTGAVEAAADFAQTSRAFTAAEINSGKVKVYVPFLKEDAAFIKVSVMGSAAGGSIEAYLESYVGK
jgi:hypothetical protein